MSLTSEHTDLIGNFPLGFVASLRPDGRPAVSPKGTFLVLDKSTVAFGDIRSPGTMRNLEHQAYAEANFIDPFTRISVRLAGKTRKLARGTDDFDTLIPRWHDVWGDLASRINALVVIDIQTASSVTTPPYDDGATEGEMIALYKSKFAEIYP